MNELTGDMAVTLSQCSDTSVSVRMMTPHTSELIRTHPNLFAPIRRENNVQMTVPLSIRTSPNSSELNRSYPNLAKFG